MTGETVTGVNVLDKAMAIINACEIEPRTTTEVAEYLGMPAPTAHRLVRALRAHGLVARDAEGRIGIGARFRWSQLEGVAREHLESLARDTGETAQLWVARGEARLCRISISSRNVLRAEYPEGSLLAFSEGGTAARALQGHVGDAGWAETTQPRGNGLSGISAPVRQNGEVVAAVCLAAPASRGGTMMGAMYGARVLDVAARIEAAVAALTAGDLRG